MTAAAAATLSALSHSHPKTRRRQRSNTTSTLLINDTIAKPNDGVAIRSVAAVISDLINRHTTTKPAKTFAVFDIYYSSFAMSDADVARTTTPQHIAIFINHLFTKGQLAPETNVMAISYITRLCDNTGLTLNARNWRHVVVGAYIMASKVWDDLSMINEDFTVVMPWFSLKQINQLELAYLEALDFTVTVSGSEYAKTYFALRESYEKHAKEHGLQSQFTLHALDIDQASALETRCESHQLRVTQEARKRKVTDLSQSALRRPRTVIS